MLNIPRKYNKTVANDLFFPQVKVVDFLISKKIFSHKNNFFSKFATHLSYLLCNKLQLIGCGKVNRVRIPILNYKKITNPKGLVIFLAAE